MAELEVFPRNQGLAFAESEKVLDWTCRHLREAVNCIDNFSNRCFDRKQRNVYRTLTSGVQELISDLCTPDSTVRKQFLAYAPCYESLGFEYQKCFERHSRNQESFKREINNEKKLQKACCSFEEYKHCIRRAILTKCNKEAADIGEQVVTKPIGSLLRSYCSEFKHGSPVCSLGSSTSSPSPFTGIFSIFIIFISWLLSYPY